jgi:hypothetical protein
MGRILVGVDGLGAGVGSADGQEWREGAVVWVGGILQVEACSITGSDAIASRTSSLSQALTVIPLRRQ